MIYSVSNTKYNHSINTVFTPIVFHKPRVIVQTCMMSNVCTECQNGDENNVCRYCFDHAIGDRTWHGTDNDIDVISFVHEHEKEIVITFETA